MATLNQKVEQALGDNFAGADIKLTRSGRGKRLGGTVVWDGFEGKPQIDRQTELRRAIRAALPLEDQSQVSFILTLTPEEFVSVEKDD